MIMFLTSCLLIKTEEHFPLFSDKKINRPGQINNLGSLRNHDGEAEDKID